MLNTFFKILILVIVVSTLAILGIKPKMHSRVLIYDSSYTIVENTPDTTIEVALPEVKQTVSDEKTTKVEVKKENSNSNNLVSQNKVEKKKTADVQKKEIKETPKPKTTTVVNKNTDVVKQEPKKVETLKPEQKKVQTTTVAKQPPKQETTVKVQQQVKETPKEKVSAPSKIQTMTEKEEEIAWNIWRSNLQNQIMKDTKLPYIPKGTIFKFSFDVDKYGRLSNIKVWSQNPNYTPHAIQYIAPVIRSYQGKDILDFPKGTQRISTTFKGGWKISDNAVYSTPNDYNDIEKVKR